MMQATASASSASGSGAGAYLRSHPIVVLGILAALFAVGFGVYVYLQIFNPGLLIGRPQIAAKAPPPLVAQAPAVPAGPAASPAAEPLSSAPLLK